MNRLEFSKAIQCEAQNKACVVGKSLANERKKCVSKLCTLAKENELFHHLLEQTREFNITVYDVTDQHQMIYANSAACEYFGVDMATLLSWTPYDFNPSYNDTVKEDMARRIHAGECFTFETEHRLANGELVPVEINVHPLKLNGRQLSVVHTHDIRERKIMEVQRLQYETAMARRDVEDHYCRLVESLPDFIVRLDPQARFTYINPAMLKNIGRDEQAFLGKTAVEAGVMNSEEAAQLFYEQTLSAFESGQATVYQEWGLLTSGKRCFEIRHIPEQDEAGKVVSVLAIARDVTEQVRIDNTLKFIAQRSWSLYDEPFLIALARYLSKMLAADYVIIDRLTVSPHEAETVALFAKGELQPNICYSLKGSPCEQVMAGTLCCYSQAVQAHFPDDEMLSNMGVESYIGLPLWDSSGKVIGLITVMNNQPITNEVEVKGLLQLVASRAAAKLERERSERALKTREREYRRLLDDSPDVIVRYDSQCRRIYSNNAHCRIMNSPTSFLGKTPLQGWGVPTNMAAVENYQEQLRKVLDSGESNEWELAWHDADGKAICFLVRGTPEFDDYDQVSGVLIVGRDISARKQLEAATLAREQEFRALVENSPDCISRFDRQSCCTYINPSCTRIFAEKAVLGKTLVDVYPGYAPAQDYEARLQHVLHSGEDVQFLFPLTLEDGQQYCYDMHLVPERDDHGQIISVLAIGRDISDRLHLEDELRRQASIDVLTKLPNRWAFGEKLSQEIAQAERGSGNGSLLFIDLDRFKEVNDSLGHEIGDQLLTEAAQRIQLCIRKSDIVARLGGDEFVIILPAVIDVAHAGGVAQKIIDALTKPFTFCGHMAYVSASIGIASYPWDADNADALLSCADKAMYVAKERGRSGFSFFAPYMQTEVEGRIHLAHDLRDALAEQQFQLHFQPIVDITTGRVVKAEALLRWQHPVRGMVSPEQFIPIAEDTGMIHQLGDWVFHQALMLAQQWRKQWQGEHVQVSVNISPRQFIHGQNFETWFAQLARLEVPGACVAIEITEGLLLDDQDSIKEKLSRFRAAGMQVALDDFGTGYSAMAYIKKFNIDYLKIDRSFVRDMAIDESDRAIAETIVAMAKRLGLKTIAEGVETTEQLELLAGVGCEYVQGYLYSRPLPADEFLAYVGANSYTYV